MLAAVAKKDKQESEATQRRMKEMEDRTRRVAAEAEAKTKEVSDLQAQVCGSVCVRERERETIQTCLYMF